MKLKNVMWKRDFATSLICLWFYGASIEELSGLSVEKVAISSHISRHHSVHLIHYLIAHWKYKWSYFFIVSAVVLTSLASYIKI